METMTQDEFREELKEDAHHQELMRCDFEYALETLEVYDLCNELNAKISKLNELGWNYDQTLKNIKDEIV